MTQAPPIRPSLLMDVGFSLMGGAAIILELGVYAVVGASALKLPWSAAVGWAFALYALVRFVVILFTHALAYVYRSPRPPEHVLSVAQWVKLIAAEYYALLVLMLVLVPFELAMRPHNRFGGRTDKILFVHGFGCNAGYWWPTIRYLHKRGISGIYSINLGPGFSKIERYAEQLADRIDELCDAGERHKIVLIAHSMGGLVARKSILRPGTANKVARLITVATPHHGTLTAYFSPTADARQMRPGSEFLQNLSTAAVTMPSVPVTSLLSYDDNVVIPQLSSELCDADNHKLSGIGHLSMSFSLPVKRWLFEQLRPMLAQP